MRRSRRAPVLAVLVAVAVALTGCLPDQVDGQQEGADATPVIDLTWFEESSAQEVVDAGLVAMAAIRSVRLRQDADNPVAGDTGPTAPVGADPVVSKDLLIATGEGIGDAADGDCTGTLQLPSWSRPAELLVEDDLGVFRAGSDFWSDLGGVDPAVRPLLAGQYAEEWTTVPGLATLCDFTDFLQPVTDLVGDEDVVKAGLGDVDGVPAGRVVSSSDEATVTTWVRLEEPHLVLRVAVERRTGADASTGRRTVTTFSETDSRVDVDFPDPADVVSFALPPTPVTAG